MAEVSSGSKADLTAPKSNFRFALESGLGLDIAPGQKCAKTRHLGMPAMAGDIGSEVADPDYSGRPEARIASIRGVASTGTQPMAEH
jgi:hypothetical protein